MAGTINVVGRIPVAIGLAALLFVLFGCGSGDDTATPSEGGGADVAAESSDEVALGTDPPTSGPVSPSDLGPPERDAPEAIAPEALEPEALEPEALEPEPAVDSPPETSADAMPPIGAAGSPPPAEEPQQPQALTDTEDGAVGGAPDVALEGALPPLVTEELALSPEMLALIEAGDVVAGRTYATRCTACHALDPGGLAPAAAQIGPSLYGIYGARIGGVPGFDYSPVFEAMYEADVAWTAARLDAFLANPMGEAPGTAMDAGTVADPVNRANVIAFIRSLAISPLPIEGVDPTATVEGNPELLAMIAEADVDQGRSLAARCSGCHRFGEDETGLIGPNLYNIVGAAIGAEDGYVYSPALRSLNEDGEIWTYDRLDAFLEGPAAAIPGTRMGFGGVDNIRDRAAIIAYLRQLAADPFPLQVDGGDEIGVAREGLQPVTFTAVQVEDGALGYLQRCADCHADSLRGEVDMRLAEGGIGVAPPLIGPNFEHQWFAGPVGILFEHIMRREPNDAPGTLSPEAYADILAFVLERNGFRPGEAPLPTDPAELNNLGFFQE